MRTHLLMTLAIGLFAISMAFFASTSNAAVLRLTHL